MNFRLESSFPLNKSEKHELILKLLNEGKTYRDICHIVHVSARDIKPIAKEYERKKRLETRNGEQITTKKPSISSQAFKLFSDGKTQVQVAIDLDLDYEKVRKYWTEFLRLNNMKKLYEIFEETEFKLKYIFKIYYFILRNKIDFKEIESVLKYADDIIGLNKYLYNLKLEVNMLEKQRNNLQYYTNNNSYSLRPL